jgi:excisionase family DNA binding protein
MSQGFYTLEEAAAVLGMSTEDLNRMAQRREVRAFADRGTWRFRTQDIDDLAQKGVNPAPADEPAPAKATTGVSGTNLSGGMDDISFEDISLDDLPMDDPPQTQVAGGAPKATAIAGAGLDEDLIPTTEEPFGEEPAADPAQGPVSAIGLQPASSDADIDIGPGPAGILSDPEIGLEPAQSEDVALGGEVGQPKLSDTQRTKAPRPSAVGGGDISDVRLDMDQGSFDFDLKTESSGRLSQRPKTQPPASPSSSALGGKSSPRLTTGKGGGDSDVRLDFDGSTLDDSLIPMGKPDSDVRVNPVSMAPPASQVGAGLESVPTDEIDLDAELEKADLASQERRGKTKPPHRTTGQQGRPKSTVPPSGKTQAPPAAAGTMLPTSSPFELSEDDLELSSGSSSGERKPLGSEFELTLAPEDEGSPLALGDDEDVDLGGLPPKGDAPSSQRAELSGINLHDPADSGISLEEGSASDSVDFELTVDDDATSGPKTIKGKVPDSDSEFELTLDSSSSLPPSDSMDSLAAESASGEQKDIFETDFDLPPLEEEESGSQAVALESADTDLESSDFDLALEEGETSTSSTDALDESGSQVVVLDEDEDAAAEEAPAPKKQRGFSQLGEEGADEVLLDEDLEGAEAEGEGGEDDGLEPSAATIPAKEADWGFFPILILVPCVLLMFVAGLMSYELLHGMWGYHQTTKPTGLVVSGMAKLFDAEVKE